ncbi:MAG: exosome complex RNA-binding protein Rrp4 [Thermofilum sp.]
MSGEKRIVVPGDLVQDRAKARVEGAVYKVNSQIRSKVLGVVLSDDGGKTLKVVPLKGKYIPSEGDLVIGKIVEVGFTSWTVDINSPYLAVLPVSEVTSKPVTIPRSDLSKILDEGDLILARVVSFDKSKEPVLTIKESRLGKIERGIVVEISPNKVPRVIGKKGSMVKLLEELLEVNIIVGQNGRVLVVGRNEKREELAAIVIKKIEAEAHTEGLTSKVREYIKARLT